MTKVIIAVKGLLTTASLRPDPAAAAKHNAVRIDLRAVEFAELDALAQLLLLIDHAARAGRKVRVDLPTPLLKNQEPAGEQQRTAARMRSRCRRFLYAVGFVSAAALPHHASPDVRIRDRVDEPDDLKDWTAGVVTGAEHDPTAPPIRVVPFRWVSAERGESLWSSDGLVSIIRELRDLGLSQSEAQLLGNNVLFELVANVARHTTDERPVHALVGAIATSTIFVRLSDGRIANPLIGDITWPDQPSNPTIRIVVGDSAAGGPNRDWLTTVLPADAPAEAQRLWRARRSIEAFGHSAVLVGAADKLVGLIFDDGRTDEVERPYVSLVSGAVVDIVIPSARRVIGATEPSGVETSAYATGLDLAWVRLDPSEGDAAVRVRRLAASGRDLLLTADGGTTHHVSHERLLMVLRLAGEAANSVFVALVATGVDPVAVDTAIEELRDNPTQIRSFLVIDGVGGTRWCGSGPTGTVTPSVVLSRLARLVSDALDDALSREGPGVHVGTFRTPNLHMTNRWVDVRPLLKHRVSVGIAGLLAATRIRATADPAMLDQDVRVVQLSDQAIDLSLMIAESLQVRRPLTQMTEEYQESGAIQPLRRGTRAVLVADIVLTENRIRECLRQLWTWGVTTVAVVTALDARERDEPVRAGGITLDVISLARVHNRVGAATGTKVVDIDPVLRVPVRQPPAEAIYRWSHDDFLRECAELPSVLRLGHVVRPNGRHFTVYFDAGRIIDSTSRLRDQIAEEALRTVEEWRTEPNRRITICFAGSQDGYGRRLAELIAARLTARRPDVSEPALIQVPRAFSAGKYAFPDSITDEFDAEVIVVDWGSFDATTLLQLVRLAADAGARRILGIVLLSQLAMHEERTITMMRSVAPAKEDLGESQVRFRFLTTIGITPTNGGECRLCRIAESLTIQSRNGVLPREVAAHANSLATSLRPLDREQLAKRGFKDAYGAQAAAEDGIEYARLRRMLLLAQRSTSQRAAVAEYLASVGAMSKSLRSHAIIRLLAAEAQWIRLSPLSLEKYSRHLAALAVSVATDRELDERLRLQAIIVLWEAAPERLLEQLPAMWVSALHSDELLLHLLYVLWLMATPDAEIRRVSTVALRREVNACLDVHPDGYESPDRAEDMQYLLTRVLGAADFGEASAHELDVEDAWGRLRTSYLYTIERHADAETAAVNLMVFMAEPPAESGPLEDDVWHIIRSGWRDIATYLQNNVLDSIGSLGSIFAGAFAHEYLTSAQRQSLQSLASGYAARDLVALESQIYELRHGDLSDHAFGFTWTQIYRQISDLHRSVLSAADDQSRAYLAAFIEPCPADAIAVINECVQFSERRGEPVDVEVVTDVIARPIVFCHHDLLRSAVQHIISNATKPSHQDPANTDDRVRMQVQLTTNDTIVYAVFRNDGTMPTTDVGKGLSSMRRKLTDFKATVTPRPPTGAWTYEIELALVLWASPGTGGVDGNID